jgi:hypothetical protein
MGIDVSLDAVLTKKNPPFHNEGAYCLCEFILPRNIVQMRFVVS